MTTQGALPGPINPADLLASAVGVWSWDVRRGVLQADSRFARLYGLDRAELARGLPSEAFFSAIHPADRLRLRVAVAGVMHGADLFNKEFRLLQPDDGVRWVAARGRPERDEEGRVIRFDGVLTDITEQKRIEERLRVAQSAGGVGTFEYVAGFGTVDVSSQFCRLLGLTPTDAVALRSINAVLPQDSPPLITLDGLSEGEQPTREFRIVRTDNAEVRWIARKGEVRSDGAGGGPRFIGVIYDITAFKAAEARLRDLTETLEERVAERTRERDRVWNNSRDLLVVTDLQGRIVSASPSWTRILGYEPDALIGLGRADLVAPQDLVANAAAFERAVQGEDLNNFESRFLHKDGSLRWISWRTTIDEDLVFAYGRDVTEERERADALRRAEDQLRQAQKMEAVGQLTGGIAHDFNNMLTGVIGGLDLIKKRIGEGRLDGLDRFMEGAIASAQRAAGLTHRLLAFSRQQSLDPRPIHAGQLIQSMEDLLTRTLGEQIRLVVQIDPDLWLAVADANQLESAILNLAINARDAMPSGGTLKIVAANVTLDANYVAAHADATAGDHVAITVSDTGVGMAPEVLAKAFDPFFTTKPIGQGTGLGLSMIYGFVRQSGGHAVMESAPGAGAAMTLYLPRAVAAPEAIDPREGQPSRRASSGQTVLVVEDEASVRGLMVEVLADLGYRVLQAANGDAAMELVKSATPIDLLVSDVGLPGLNGRQVAEMALKRRPGLPVLFVTGYAPGATDRGDFLAPGMEMISKPFNVDVFAAKVAEMAS